MKAKKTAISIISIVVLCAALALFFILGGAKLIDGEKTEADSSGTDIHSPEPGDGLFINEIVSSGKRSLILSDGSSPDWIEIYNGTSASVSLNGLCLTDDPSESVKCKLPGITVASGEYCVFLLTGNDGQTVDGFSTLGIRLSSRGGEILCVTDTSGNILQSIELPQLADDISYGRDTDGKYKYFAEPTPGEKNSQISSESPGFEGITVEPGEIVINEYQLLNKMTLRDSDGEYSEWVELKNTSGESRDISGYGLSDSLFKKGKWSFETTVLEPGECITVFLSGKDRRTGEIHANFRINNEETQIVLTDNAGKISDIAPLKKDSGTASVGRSSDDITEWLYYPSATPGKDNITKGFSEMDKNSDKYLPN